MKIVVDTNSLIYAVKGKFDLFSELKKTFSDIIIPKGVMKEMKVLSISAQRTSDKVAAKIAIQIVEHSKVKIIDIGNTHIDDRIVVYAKDNSCAVLTNDAELKSRLKNEKIPVFIISKNSKIKKA
tara:strand:+ start:7899 stop:8273 length:375 start_codon:yes stop_codon:yes gene_type:complete